MAGILSLIDSLPNSSNKIDTLKDIKTFLVSIQPIELREAVGNVSFNVIFECLNTSEKEQLEVCSAVLDGLLSACDANTLLHQFHNDLYQGLCHADENVKKLCLKQVLLACKSSPQQVAQYSNVVCRLVEIVGEKQLPIAKLAMEILTLVGGTVEGLECIFHGNGFDSLQTVVNKGDEVRYRAFEVIVDIAKLSQESLHVCEASGFLQRLLNDIDTDDILIQLNALELVTQLSCTTYGLYYLDQKGIITRLEQMLQNMGADPLMAFLLPGLLKFFGNIAHLQPKEVGGRLEPFINTVFSHTESTDLSVRTVAIETLGHVGSTPDGKKALDKQGNKMTEACRNIGNTLKNATTEIKVRVVDAVSNLLHLRVSDQTEELLALMESWYNSLTPDALAFIMKQADQPFLQLRCGAFTFLRVLANQPWGQKHLNDFAAFHEYILNRSTENTKEGKEGKFEVVKTLVDSPTAMDIFGRVYFMKLREYHNDGPFFVKAESSVAFEGDS